MWVNWGPPWPSPLPWAYPLPLLLYLSLGTPPILASVLLVPNLSSPLDPHIHQPIWASPQDIPQHLKPTGTQLTAFSSRFNSPVLPFSGNAFHLHPTDQPRDLGTILDSFLSFIHLSYQSLSSGDSTPK